MRIKKIYLSMVAAIAAFGLVSIWMLGCSGSGDIVRIGSKNFTEQIILGELMAQIVEDQTDLQVQRKFNLGGTMICHRALIQNDIDLYPEYTGTALTAVLQRDVTGSPEEVYKTVMTAYREKFACEWLTPFGFNNTYAITVRRADAEANGWAAISDLIPFANRLRAGFTAEFAERPDGYPGLKDTYGLAFAEVSDLDPGLMYQAIAQKQVDIISAFSTDGRIVAYDLVPLDDDKSFFPPYYAAPVVRRSLIEIHAEVREVLNALAGILNDETMQQLNYEVDEKNISSAVVAQRFLENRGLLTKRRGNQ